MWLPGIIGGKTRQKLTVACEENGIILNNAHCALNDTIATANLFDLYLKKSLNAGYTTFADLKNVGKKYKFIQSWDYEPLNTIHLAGNFPPGPIVKRDTNAKKVSRNNTELYQTPVKPKAKEGCYIATAIYGDYNALEVRKLRYFRDRYLFPYFIGRLITTFYYHASPGIADKIKKLPVIKRMIKYLLDWIVQRIKEAV